MEKIAVTWKIAGDKSISADVLVGHNLMEAAIENNVPGIAGECGGALACATCHVVVEKSPQPLEGPEEMEVGMLEMAAAPVEPGSRLSCQIIASPELDGIVLRVPTV